METVVIKIHISNDPGGAPIPNIPKTSGPTRITVLVLNPDHIGIDLHYRRLNAVARIFRGEGIVERLTSAQNEQEVLAVLQDTGANS